jgi:hypothetical protein
MNKVARIITLVNENGQWTAYYEWKTIRISTFQELIDESGSPNVEQKFDLSNIIIKIQSCINSKHLTTTERKKLTSILTNVKQAKDTAQNQDIIKATSILEGILPELPATFEILDKVNNEVQIDIEKNKIVVSLEDAIKACYEKKKNHDKEDMIVICKTYLKDKKINGKPDYSPYKLANNIAVKKYQKKL